METNFKVSTSTVEVITVMRSLDNIYLSLKDIVAKEFGEEKVETYLKDLTQAQVSVGNLMKDMILLQLGESDYKSL